MHEAATPLPHTPLFESSDNANNKERERERGTTEREREIGGRVNRLAAATFVMTAIDDEGRLKTVKNSQK